MKKLLGAITVLPLLASVANAGTAASIASYQSFAFKFAPSGCYKIKKRLLSSKTYPYGCYGLELTGVKTIDFYGNETQLDSIFIPSSEDVSGTNHLRQLKWYIDKTIELGGELKWNRPDGFGKTWAVTGEFDFSYDERQVSLRTITGAATDARVRTHLGNIVIRTVERREENLDGDYSEAKYLFEWSGRAFR